jgi:predicted methyltransferase
MKKINYKKMLKAIDEIVNNDWGFEMIDMKHDFNSKDKDKYLNFTQAEAIEMSKALAKIYRISHTISCEACRDEKFIINPTEGRLKAH